MALRDYLPIFKQVNEAKQATSITLDDQRALMKTFKVAALALGIPTTPINLKTRTNFEFAPYDFNRIIQAIDTDGYVNQAFNKYSELFWKEGWDIVSENHEAVNYMWQRIDFMEMAMNRPFQDFLNEACDQLFKFHNVFIVKARGNLKPYFPAKVDGVGEKDPVVGYYVLPTEQVEILRDRNNKPRWYRQRLDATQGTNFNGNSRIFPTWKAEEVIHLFRKKKPGRAFGTPFMVAALDDIIALRQVEEDLQNLVHKELFPLYKYMIGTDDHPASPEEIEQAKVELDSLRSEGGLIMPHRHDVDVIGGEGKSLDAAPYLTHFKERVAVGLGMFPHHLGMVAQSDRSVTDRLDVALFDRIKEYQKYFSDAVRFHLFNELLQEGGFDPFESPQETGVSDRCNLRFNEIDVDTQVKKEANILQKVAAGVETIPEARLELNMKPEMDESQTAGAQQVRLMPDQPIQTKKADGTPGQPKLADTTPAAAKGVPQAKVPNANPSSGGGSPNMRNLKKGAGNVIRPTNQYGTRTSPNIRRVDDDWLDEVAELLGDDVYYDIEESDEGV